MPSCVQGQEPSLPGYCTGDSLPVTAQYKITVLLFSTLWGFVAPQTGVQGRREMGTDEQPLPWSETAGEVAHPWFLCILMSVHMALGLAFATLLIIKNYSNMFCKIHCRKKKKVALVLSHNCTIKCSDTESPHCGATAFPYHAHCFFGN